MPHCDTVLLQGVEHSLDIVEVCAVGAKGEELCVGVESGGRGEEGRSREERGRREGGRERAREREEEEEMYGVSDTGLQDLHLPGYTTLVSDYNQCSSPSGNKAGTYWVY